MSLELQMSCNSSPQLSKHITPPHISAACYFRSEQLPARHADSAAKEKEGSRIKCCLLLEVSL